MKHIFLILTCAVLLTACRTSRQAQSSQSALTPSGQGTGANAAAGEQALAYATRIASGKVSQNFLIASAKARVGYGSQSLSVNARLSMKRDDVVRISLRLLGMEVGLLEFTPADVLVVDRYNKRYVRAAYSEVDFLRAAGLDFYSLQALFWNELFAPGERNATRAASRFALSGTADRPVLTLADAPRLSYAFTTIAQQGVVEQLVVKGKNSADRGEFSWQYGAFTPYGGRQFPTSMQMKVTGTGTDASLSLELSGLKSDSDWNTRTTVPAKYKRLTVSEIFKGLKF